MHSPHPGHGLTLMLLGGFDARLNGSPVSGFSYDKMRALLAYLVVERPQDHRRELLADLLWCESDTSTARANLRRTLSNLRRALEAPTGKTLFLASKNSIRFVSNIYSDVLAFTGQVDFSAENQDALLPCVRSQTQCSPCLAQMEEMAALYQGQFMAGFSLPGCPNFENWLGTQREAMHLRALALLEQLSNCHLTNGDPARALQFALRYAELEPWNEDANCRLMHIYELNGQPSAALAQYKAYCRLLDTELDLLPNDKIRNLAQRIGNSELQISLPDTVETPPFFSHAAERRQVTVMFCELTLATLEEPDEAMALLQAPQARCIEIIQRFSGHLVQPHGGGLLAYFSYPQASEGAARHAVEAALAIANEASPTIAIRVGVHTGLIITSPDSPFPDTVGKTSRLAIELRHNAKPGQIAISQETHTLVAGYFKCISLGIQKLPGFQRSLEIFCVSRNSGARSRLGASTALTPLAGRQTEIARLLELWEKATQDDCQVALIRGEAGIGKSRLLHTLKAKLSETRCALIELRCLPEFSQSPFHPLVEMLESRCGFKPGDKTTQKIRKLTEYLAAHQIASSVTPALIQLLSLQQVEHGATPDVPRKVETQQIIGTLLALLRKLGEQQPLLLIIEDLQWIDASTQTLLSTLVEQKCSGRQLTVLTARLEFAPPWPNTIGSTLKLAALGKKETTELLTSIRNDLPAATIACLVERADGVPLFAEELAKIASADTLAFIPTTLLDFLIGEIDKLGEAKATAQLAATIGHTFDLDLLRKLAQCDDEILRQRLNTLNKSGLVWQINETTSRFKHALIQETVYQSQTKADRQAIHRRIASVLRNDFPDIAKARPEFLAQHLSFGRISCPPC